MARLIPDADRGQMFLVVAVVVAALLVVLTVVLNSALYAGNLTASDDGVDETSALGYRSGVVEGIGPLVTHANRHDNTSYTALQTAVEARVETWSDLAGQQAAAEVSGASASLDSISEGTLIDQLDETRAYTNDDGVPDWELVDSTQNVRAFHLNVTQSVLEDPAPSEESSASALASAGVFNVTLDDGSDVWRVFVYANGTNVSVKVDDPIDGFSEACEVPPGPKGNVTVDLSNGTVGDRDCPQLDVLDDPTSPFDVRFGDGSNAAGTYSLVVQRELAFVDDGDLGSVAGPPRASYALYSVDVKLTYVTPELRYETTVEVVPGETP